MFVRLREGRRLPEATVLPATTETLRCRLRCLAGRFDTHVEISAGIDGGGEGSNHIGADFKTGLAIEDADGTDIAFGHAPDPAN